MSHTGGKSVGTLDSGARVALLSGVRWISVLLLVAACGAGELDPPDDGSAVPRAEPEAEEAAVTTDRMRYRYAPGPSGDEVEIRSTLTASDDQRIYIVNCNGAIAIGLQSQTEVGWRDAWAGIINQCLSEPIVLEPGESHEYTLVLNRGSGTVHEAPHEALPRGTYRVIWNGVVTSFDAQRSPFGTELPEDQRASAPIVLE